MKYHIMWSFIIAVVNFNSVCAMLPIRNGELNNSVFKKYLTKLKQRATVANQKRAVNLFPQKIAELQKVSDFIESIFDSTKISSTIWRYLAFILIKEFEYKDNDLQIDTQHIFPSLYYFPVSRINFCKSGCCLRLHFSDSRSKLSWDLKSGQCIISPNFNYILDINKNKTTAVGKNVECYSRDGLLYATTVMKSSKSSAPLRIAVSLSTKAFNTLELLPKKQNTQTDQCHGWCTIV